MSLNSMQVAFQIKTENGEVKSLSASMGAPKSVTSLDAWEKEAMGALRCKDDLSGWIRTSSYASPRYIGFQYMNPKDERRAAIAINRR